MCCPALEEHDIIHLQSLQNKMEEVDNVIQTQNSIDIDSLKGELSELKLLFDPCP